MTNAHLSTRDFLKLTAASALAAGTGALTNPLQAAAQKKIPIGLQLYSVRNECEKDLPGTVAAVAKIGYRAVEFAGYYGRDAKTLRNLLDDHGLKCCGTHIGLETLLGDNLLKTIEFNRALGNLFLIVPGLGEQYTKTRTAWQNTAAIFNELADKVKPHGMRVGYHNHTIEFTELDGELPWDTFFGRTKKEVVMQFDTGNAMHGGGDATVYLKRYPGRATTIHLKEHSKTNPKALIGEGDINWAEVLRLCRSGGTRWYIIEEEKEGLDPLTAVDLSLKNFKKLIR